MPEATFADRLVRARAAKRLAQLDLAGAANIAPAQVSRYERGLSVPRPHILAKLAEVLDVDDQWLAYGTGRDPFIKPGQGGEVVILEIPASLHQALEKIAAARGESFEGVVVAFLRKSIELDGAKKSIEETTQQMVDKAMKEIREQYADLMADLKSDLAAMESRVAAQPMRHAKKR